MHSRTPSSIAFKADRVDRSISEHKRDVGRGSGGLDLTDLVQGFLLLECRQQWRQWYMAGRIRYSVGLHHSLNEGFEQRVVCGGIQQGWRQAIHKETISLDPAFFIFKSQTL